MRLPLSLSPRRSRLLTVVQWLAHALAAVAIAAAELETLIKLALWILVAVSFWRQSRPCLPAQILLKADGRLILVERDGGCREAMVETDTTVYSWLVVLRLKVDGRRLALSLPFDSLDGNGHRKLRLWLRWLTVNAPA